MILSAVGLWGWLVYPRVMVFYLRLSLPKGRLPHLGLPRTADDKFLWRKLFDHDPLFTILCDKVAVKTWAREACPDLDTAPLLWAGPDPADIPEAVLAGDVIVKANHGCGTNLILRGGHRDRAALIAQARAWLATDHGKRRREWGYADIPRQILVEPLMAPASDPVQDLKYYCFGDRILRMIQIVGRSEGSMSARIYEPDAAGSLQVTDIPAEVTPLLYHGGLPGTATRAEDLARRIGAGLDHVRVDFLTNGKALWLGEMTLYNLAGRLTRGGSDPGHPANLAWDLRRTHFLRNPPRTGWRARYAAALLRELNRQAGDRTHGAD
jgi:hypothetical protein